MANIKKNYVWNTVYQILTLAVPLFITPYISRVLGADGIGIYSYTNSMVSYFVLFATLGTTIYGQRSIAFAQKNIYKCSRCFYEIVCLRAITTLFVGVIYSFFLLRNAQYHLYYLIMIPQLLNVIFDISWFFQGVEEFAKIVIRNMIIKVCSVLCIFLFVKSKEDLWLYMLFLAGFNMIGNLSLWILIPKYLCRVNTIKPLSHLKGAFQLFIPSIATQVYMVLDKSMIGSITGSTYQNGCYEQAENIARIALVVVGSIATVITPRVSRLYKEGNDRQMKRYIYIGYRFVLMIAIPSMFGMIGISGLFIPVFLGDGFALAILLMNIFSILLISVGLACITGPAYLIATNQQNIYTTTVVIAAAVNFLLNTVLIPSIGATGAAIASVAAEAVGAGLQIAYCCIKKQLQLGLIFGGFWKYALSGLIMLLVLLQIQPIMSMNIVGLLVLISVGVCVYFGCVILLRDDFFVKNLRRVFLYVLKKAGRTE